MTHHDPESIPIDVVPPDTEGRLIVPIDIIRISINVKDVPEGEPIYLAPGTFMRDSGVGVMFIDINDRVPDEEPKTLHDFKSRPVAMKVAGLAEGKLIHGYIIDCRYAEIVKENHEVDFSKEYSADIGYDEHKEMHGSEYPLAIIFSDKGSLRYIGDIRYSYEMEELMESVDSKVETIRHLESENNPQYLAREIARLAAKLQQISGEPSV